VQAEQLRQQQEAQLRQQEALRQQQAQAQQEALQRQQQEAKLAQQQKEAAQKQQAQAVAEQQALQNQQLQQQAANTQNGQANALDALTSGLGDLSVASSASRTTEATKNPAPGILGAGTQGGSLETGTSYLSALNESFSAAPGTADNERARVYTPKNPYPTPSSFPSTPAAVLENPEIFEKLGTDALFFVFYHLQGTYQQYLAARELKKQSWRFHKKYMTWFQRHEEPKITTDEYEQGTYLYFDYETGWCTRIKADFRFEYAYLEDSLQ
jgi:CCR4-NOT transcription complex subunit 3